MRLITIFLIAGSVNSALLALSEQELAVYRNHVAERLFKEVPGIVSNLRQRVGRIDIPTNKEVHLAFAATVIANLLPPSELQIFLNMPQFKNIPQRAEIFGGQPESARAFLEIIVAWLDQLAQLRFEGKQYLSNYISEFVKLAPYAQEVISDPDDWQAFVNQLRKFQTIIASAQFLREHQDLKPKDIQFALSLLNAPIRAQQATPADLSDLSQQLSSIKERMRKLQQQMPAA